MMTREQMLEARKAAERATMQAKIAAARPEISASRVAGGVRVRVKNPTAAIRATLAQHDFELVVDIANTYARVCATPAELDVVQDALREFFPRPPVDGVRTG